MNIIVAIGFGASSTWGALDNGESTQFGAAVRNQIKDHGKLLAEIYGESYSEGWGQEPAAWFAGTTTAIEPLKAVLRDLAIKYGRDAIVVLSGETVLVSPE